MKLLLTTDIHSGTTRESTSRPGIIRQASSDALRKIKEYQKQWRKLACDASYDLGDLTKPIHNDPHNEELYQLAVDTLKSINNNIKFIPGNHDIDGVGTKKMLTITKQDSFLGIDYIDDWQILRLDQEQLDVNNARLRDESIMWVKANLKKNIKTIVLSHYSLAKHDMGDSFGFENKDDTTCYQNSEEIIRLLNDFETKAAVNGHTHWSTYKTTARFPIIGLLPFTDNILDSCNVNINPGIYSVLKTDGDNISLKTYSGQFCFASIEL